jgi:large conductance mechanosensitive channel
MAMLKEFKEFAVKGNMVDMAVGIVLGAAFTTVIKSVVDGILMPPLGLLTGGVDFSALFLVLKEGTAAGPYATVAEAQAAGAVVLSWGVLVNNIVSFLIVAFTLFVVVRWINKLKRAPKPAVPNTRACPFCLSNIEKKASRCPHCTSTIEPVAAA